MLLGYYEEIYIGDKIWLWLSCPFPFTLLPGKGQPVEGWVVAFHILLGPGSTQHIFFLNVYLFLNPEIMTWVKIRFSTDQATQAPHTADFIYLSSIYLSSIYLIFLPKLNYEFLIRH